MTRNKKTMTAVTPPGGPMTDRVEEALLKRALGFQQEECYCEELVDKNSGAVVELLKRRKVTKELAPDVRALLFWLKNRCPERWQERDSDETYCYEPPEDEREL